MCGSKHVFGSVTAWRSLQQHWRQSTELPPAHPLLPWGQVWVTRLITWQQQLWCTAPTSNHCLRGSLLLHMDWPDHFYHSQYMWSTTSIFGGNIHGRCGSSSICIGPPHHPGSGGATAARLFQLIASDECTSPLTGMLRKFLHTWDIKDRSYKYSVPILHLCSILLAIFKVI